MQRKWGGREGGGRGTWPSGETTEAQVKSDLGVRLAIVDLGTQCPCRLPSYELVHPAFGNSFSASELWLWVVVGLIQSKGGIWRDGGTRMGRASSGPWW